MLIPSSHTEFLEPAVSASVSNWSPSASDTQQAWRGNQEVKILVLALGLVESFWVSLLSSLR